MLLTVDASYPVLVIDHSNDSGVTFPVRKIESGVSTDEAATNTLDSVNGYVTFLATPFLATSVFITHCLLTADGDNPYRGIGPSGIVCFSILDACSTWSCALVTNRIRIDGAA